MADSSNGAMAVPPKKKRRRAFSRRLKLTLNGSTKSFFDWTVSFAEQSYPDIGSKTYRVPPIYFNHQNVVTHHKTRNNQNTDTSTQLVIVNVSGDEDSEDDKLSSDSRSSSSSTSSKSSSKTGQDDEVSYSKNNESQVPMVDTGHIGADPALARDREFNDTRQDVGMSLPRTDNDKIKAENTNTNDSQAAQSTNAHEAQPNNIPAAQPNNAHTTKSSQQKVKVLQLPQDTLARRDKALCRVLNSVERLGRELERHGMGGLFMVGGVSYENYLNRLPKKVAHSYEVPRPQDVATRGELDILILHSNAGIVLVQVKSVGENLSTWKASAAEAAIAIKRVIIKAAGMTGRDEAVFKHVLQDLDPAPTYTKVVALPFVSRSELDKAMSHKDDLTSNCRLFLTDLKILCKDDLEDTTTRCCGENMVKHIPAPSETNVNVQRSNLLNWWLKTFHKKAQRLSLEHMKTIAGRFCGLLSSLHIQPDSKSRVEVRTYGQAVSETADRTAATFLTQQQYELLERQDRFLIIAGPPGTGKTVILKQKGREWLEQGHHVIIINFGRDQEGMPNGLALQEDINRSVPDDSSLKAERIDLGLFNEDDVGKKVQDEIQKFLSKLCPFIRSESPALSSLHPYIPSAPSALSSGGCSGNEWVSKDIAEEDKRTDSTHETDRAGSTPEGDDIFKAAVSSSDEIPKPHQRVLQMTDIDHNSLIAQKLYFIVDDTLLRPKMRTVLKTLRNHPATHSVWCSTSACRDEIQTLEYEVTQLPKVVRCPPAVQALLSKLEKQNDWKTAYTDCSVEAGLATDGPPVIFLHHRLHSVQVSKITDTEMRNAAGCHTENAPQHQQDRQVSERPAAVRSNYEHVSGCQNAEHFSNEASGEDATEKTRKETNRLDDPDVHLTINRQQTPLVSDVHSLPDAADREASADDSFPEGVDVRHDPLSCVQCAVEVSQIIKDLMKESETPEYPPLGHSKKPISDAAKSRSPGALRYRDIVIVNPLPRECSNSEVIMHICEHVLNGRRDIVKNSPFFNGLQERGVPVKVVYSSSGELALQSNEGSVILTDSFFARSLERKVVIFLPFIRTHETATRYRCSKKERYLTTTSHQQGEDKSSTNLKIREGQILNGVLGQNGISIQGRTGTLHHTPNENLSQEIIGNFSQDSKETLSQGFHVPSADDDIVTDGEVEENDTGGPRQRPQDRQALRISDRTQSEADYSNQGTSILFTSSIVSAQNTSAAGKDVSAPDTSEGESHASVLDDNQGRNKTGGKTKTDSSSNPHTSTAQVNKHRKDAKSHTDPSHMSASTAPAGPEVDSQCLTIDGILNKLSLLNREALYRAAACCVAQFILIVP